MSSRISGLVHLAVDRSPPVASAYLDHTRSARLGLLLRYRWG
jgi:hypothetical protein